MKLYLPLMMGVSMTFRCSSQCNSSIPSSPMPPKKKSSPVAPTPLNQLLKQEVSRLSRLHNVDRQALEDFAYFIIENHKKKDVKPKPLTLPQLKAAVYQYFNVKTTTQLKASGSFKLATDGMGKLDLSKKPGWETLYRKFIGILPGEENQVGKDCVNGINIFAYFKPWQVFQLNAQTASEEDIKKAYRELVKIYHPDIPSTGDARVFDRLTLMYKSILAKA
jgi:DnaJ domain